MHMPANKYVRMFWSTASLGLVIRKSEWIVYLHSIRVRHTHTRTRTRARTRHTAHAYGFTNSVLGLLGHVISLGATHLVHWSPSAWWRHQMEVFSAFLALCAGNSPVSGEFPAQRPVTRSFDVFFDLRLIKRLSKHSRGWWFETLSCPLWRHCNGVTDFAMHATKFA